MPWSFEHNAETFLQSRQEVLSQNESLYCLTWAAIARSQADEASQTSHRFLTFRDQSRVTAHAIIQQAGSHLILSPMSEGEACELADTLARNGIALQIAEGPNDPILSFCQRWTENTSARCETVMNQGLHELTMVDMPELAGGCLVQASHEHRSTLLSLMRGFATSISADAMSIDALESRADRVLAQRRAYLWQDGSGTVVAMAAVVRESPHTASISWVYTPPQYRRRGHAARVVATLSQAQLDAGKRACNLHTDLANPTSNGVYHRIGYRKISESVRLKLHPSERTA